MIQYLTCCRFLNVLEFFQDHARGQVSVEDLHIEHFIALHANLLKGLDYFFFDKERRKAKVFECLSKILGVFESDFAEIVYDHCFRTKMPL